MQEHSSSVSTMPENMSFDHGSTSDGGINPQMPWSSIQTSAQNRLPAYRIPSTVTNVLAPHHPAGHVGLATDWNLGEASSSAVQSQHHNESRKEHAWSVSSQGAPTLEESLYESSNNRPLDNAVHVGLNSHQTANGTSCLQNSGPDLNPPCMNLDSRFGNHENDDCQVAQQSNLYLSIGSSNQQVPYAGSSSDSLGLPSEIDGYVSGESEDQSGCSLNGQRTSCKRKAHGIHLGQSSEPESSNSFQHAERSQWPAVPAVQNTPRQVGVSTQTEDALGNNNGSEHQNSRPRIGDARAVPSGPFSLTARLTGESSHRNLRLRINSSSQQDHTPRSSSSTEANVGNANVSSPQPASVSVPQSRLLDTNLATHVENGSSLARSLLPSIPSVHRNPLLRWGGASGSRSSSLTALTNSRERDYALYVQSVSRNIPRSIMEHPVFVPASETGSSSQQPPANWIFPGVSGGVAGNAASTSRAGSSSRVDSSAPGSSHRNRPAYNRRLAEFVRRSLLSSPSPESGGQTSHLATESNSSTPSHEIANSSGLGDNVPNSSTSRAATLLERHLDGEFRIPYLLRNLATTGEGRSNVMSEIRQVLDMMRSRGGGDALRFEDMTMLDHPLVFGIPDMHDRHRDMRLDVDNMSYEELLALEERIGNVCTGLNEESITRHLKQKKYTRANQDEQPDTEPCAICREEYKDGENLGTLECNHDFHTDCIKQWLMLKNLCPICKTTGLTT